MQDLSSNCSSNSTVARKPWRKVCEPATDGARSPVQVKWGHRWLPEKGVGEGEGSVPVRQDQMVDQAAHTHFRQRYRGVRVDQALQGSQKRCAWISRMILPR